MTNSTARKSSCKPDKPYKCYPLFAHASGQWAKKIRGKLFYFGVWADPDAALERLNCEYTYLKDGREPPSVDVSDGCNLVTLCNEFLQSKDEKRVAGELSPRTFRDYHASCEKLLEQFGKDRSVDDLRPDDFRKYRAVLAKSYNSVVTLKNEINRVRVLFNYAHENTLIDKPVSYGSNFDRPSAKALRKARNEGGAKLYTQSEVLRILSEADPIMEAMCLLGLNCGFGNTDVSSLPRKAIDFENGWLDFPRPKTAIKRRVPLWAETLTAIQEAMLIRPKPADARGNGLCFLTANGLPFVRIHEKIQELKDAEEKTLHVPIDAISGKFKRILLKLKINGRKGLGFYTFRHCFQTYGGESKDPDAVMDIMAHADPSMSANYRHGVSDERLRAVVDTIHDWLWPQNVDDTEGGAK